MMYLVIVIAKIFEVSLATIRMVLITKGERKIGAIIAFFEVSIWLVLVSTVLDNIMQDPLKIVAYSFGFACGNYLGSLVEEKIGIGLSEMQVIVKEDKGHKLAGMLRDKGYAVTVMHGEGKNFPRSILLMYVPRKKIKSIANIVKSVEENAVVTISDKKSLYGGFGTLRK